MLAVPPVAYDDLVNRAPAESSSTIRLRVERARVNVQRRIKDAIKRLASEDESLGRYLEATVRTGTFCSYVPLST